MNHETTESLNYNPFTVMLFNVIVFGLIGFVGVWMWKNEDSFSFIAHLFNTTHIERDLLIGIIIACLFLLFVSIFTRYNWLHFPKNNYTQPLIEGTKKPFGPLCFGLTSGISEEWCFRGFLLPFLTSFVHPIFSIVFSSLIFMYLHIEQYKGQPFIHLYIFSFSVVISIVFIFTHTLWAVMMCHIFYNTVLFYRLRHGKM